MLSKYGKKKNDSDDENIMNKKKPSAEQLTWEEQRKEWLQVYSTTILRVQKGFQDKKPFAKSKPVGDDERYAVDDILKSVKAPYDKFNHNISLEDIVEILVEIWEEDDDN